MGHGEASIGQAEAAAEAAAAAAEAALLAAELEELERRQAVAAELIAEANRAYAYSHYDALRDQVAARWTRARFEANASAQAAAAEVAAAEAMVASLAEREAEAAMERAARDEARAREEGEAKVRAARSADPSHQRLERELAVVADRCEASARVLAETERELASLTTSLATVRQLHKFKVWGSTSLCLVVCLRGSRLRFARTAPPPKKTIITFPARTRREPRPGSGQRQRLRQKLSRTRRQRRSSQRGRRRR